MSQELHNGCSCENLTQPCRGASELPPAIAHKYVYQTSFEIQRYKLEGLVREMPQREAISLIMHCYECPFAPAERIYKAIKEQPL
jgi:hypothetical protein